MHKPTKVDFLTMAFTRLHYNAPLAWSKSLTPTDLSLMFALIDLKRLCFRSFVALRNTSLSHPVRFRAPLRPIFQVTASVEPRGVTLVVHYLKRLQRGRIVYSSLELMEVGQVDVERSRPPCQTRSTTARPAQVVHRVTSSYFLPE